MVSVAPQGVQPRPWLLTLAAPFTLRAPLRWARRCAGHPPAPFLLCECSSLLTCGAYFGVS